MNYDGIIPLIEMAGDRKMAMQKVVEA